MKTTVNPPKQPGRPAEPEQLERPEQPQQSQQPEQSEQPANETSSLRLEYTTSKFGRPVILLGENGRYNFSTQKGSKTSWRCVKWSHGCRANLTTVDNVLVKVCDVHKHPHYN